jgi:pimeloyl-ACP methyl ester carboxylesterase
MMSSVAAFKQEIRFTHSGDGTRLAYALAGEGYPLVRAAHWLTNIERDWQTPVWRPWFDAFGSRYRFVRYDSRGCGMSDRNATEVSLDRLVADLEAVVDAAGLDRFALLGTSQGGAVSIAYAARHPERVSHLVLLGARADRDSCPESFALTASDSAPVGTPASGGIGAVLME